MDPSRKTALLLLGLSVVLGAGWALSQTYVNGLIQVPVGPSTSTILIVTWSTMALQYLVTPLAFYVIGRRELPGFRTGPGLAAVYVGSLIGAGSIQASSAIHGAPRSYFLLPFPFFILPAAYLGLDFLFPAFSGLALARLSNGGLHPRRTGLAIPLTAMAFALASNFVYGYEALSGPVLNYLANGAAISLGLYLVTLPVQFVIFYALGQMFDIQGRAFRAFELLFLGAYVGMVVGTSLAVGAFGQDQWIVPTGGATYWQNGIVYTGMSNSLVVLLEGLNPISALPFLSFFGLALSQVGRTVGESVVAGSQVTPPDGPGACFEHSDQTVPTRTQHTNREPSGRSSLQSARVGYLADAFHDHRDGRKRRSEARGNR